MKPGDAVDAMEFMKGLTFDEVYRLRYLIRHWHALNQQGIYPPLPGPDSEDLTPEEHAALAATLEQKRPGTGPAVKSAAAPATTCGNKFPPVRGLRSQTEWPREEDMGVISEALDRAVTQYEERRELMPGQTFTVRAYPVPFLDPDREELTEAERVRIKEMTDKTIRVYHEALNRELLERYKELRFGRPLTRAVTEQIIRKNLTTAPGPGQ